MPLTGRCQCGAVRFELTRAPEQLFVCHCTECRRQSASAFGISAYVASEAVRLVDGAPRVWTRPGSRHGPVECHFCGRCGTRLWHVSRDEPGTTSVKGGALDAPADLARAVHVWTRSKLPGVVIPDGALRYPEEPDDRSGRTP